MNAEWIRRVVRHAAAVVLFAGGAAQAQSYLIDFGPLTISGAPATTASPDANGNMWNNFTPGQFIRVRDTTGAFVGGTIPEGIGFGATTGVGNSLLADEGLLAPDPGLLGELAVESATQDHIFRFSTGVTQLGLEFSSVDPGLSLTFSFLSTRAGVAGETRFAVTGGHGTSEVVVNHENNADTLGVLTGISSDPATGTIQVTLTAASGEFMFLNAMKIEVAGPGGCNAADLAEPFDILDLSDITAFIGAFTTQDPLADLDDNGLFDLGDIGAFVVAFTAGCP